MENAPNPPRHRHPAGFRFSGVDAAFLAIGAAAAGWLTSRGLGFAAFIVGWPILHFFLFCNVFRIRRRPELIWAGSFLALASASLVAGFPPWWATALASAAIAAALIAREMRQPHYHGIGWKRVNPKLRDR